jgi:hypothetical protein
MRSGITNSSPVRVKFSARTVLGFHAHQITKLAAMSVSRSIMKESTRGTDYCKLRFSSLNLPTSPSSTRTSVARALLNSSRYFDDVSALSDERIILFTSVTLNGTCSCAVARTALMVSSCCLLLSALQADDINEREIEGEDDRPYYRIEN